MIWVISVMSTPFRFAKLAAAKQNIKQRMGTLAQCFFSHYIVRIPHLGDFKSPKISAFFEEKIQFWRFGVIRSHFRTPDHIRLQRKMNLFWTNINSFHDNVINIGVGSKELLEWAPKSYWSGLQRVNMRSPFNYWSLLQRAIGVCFKELKIKSWAVS